jgi:hypothetical protein
VRTATSKKKINMTLRTFISTSFISTLLSCNSNSNTETTLSSDTANKVFDSITKVQADTLQNSNEEYANIVRIIQRGDTVFLDVDYIQYLTGDAAIEAAKKANQADTFQDADGKIHIEVPNDFFIVNENNKIRQIPIAKDCVFDFILNPDRTNAIKDNSLKSLRKIHTDGPFILTINNQGFIKKIKEVFLP